MIVFKDPLTVREVARERRVCDETVRRWIRSGRLVAERHGAGEYRVWHRDLDLFVRRHSRE